MFKTILKIGSGLILSGMTYLISQKASEKEKEYKTIVEDQSQQSLQSIHLFQLLLERGKVVCLEIYTQSLEHITNHYNQQAEQFKQFYQSNQDKSNISINSKEEKIKQIKQMTMRKISEIYSKITSMTIVSFSTYLGIVLNKKDSILKEINIQQIITEPTQQIEEYCGLVDNIIQSKQIDILKRMKDIDLREFFDDISTQLNNNLIEFIDNSIKAKIKNEDQMVFIDDLQINKFIELLMKQYCKFFENIIFNFLNPNNSESNTESKEMKENENNEEKKEDKSNLPFCQFISQVYQSIQSIEITQEFFDCSEFNQLLLEFFQL